VELAEPELARRFLDIGVEARPAAPLVLGERLRAEIERRSRVVEEAGIEKR